MNSKWLGGWALYMFCIILIICLIEHGIDIAIAMIMGVNLMRWGDTNDFKEELNKRQIIIEDLSRRLQEIKVKSLYGG